MLINRKETDRLLLRQFMDSDLPTLHAICQEAEILKWLPDWNVSMEVRKSWLEWIQSKYITSNEHEVRIMFAMEEKKTHQLIGMVGIGNKEEVNNEVEIAYFITSKKVKQGYCSEAISGIKDWAIEQFKLPFLMAIVETNNIASNRVLQKTGFQLIETRQILNEGQDKEEDFYYYRYFG